MYAVFVDGSRQYRVSEGDVVRIDYRDLEVGATLELGRVLLTADGNSVKIGTPTVEGAKVVAEVVAHSSVKQYIQHFRRRKNYRRMVGHRQPYLQVKVKSISAG
jgi:large subunit ribosomal protein L21